MPVSAETYERLALEDDLMTRELYHGCLREKPPMTMEHGLTSHRLQMMLGSQLSMREYLVSEDSARLLYQGDNYFVPDICVLPIDLVRQTLARRAGRLEAYDQPVPFAAEIWSPSTRAYDAREKLTEYQRRGDAEIWLVHPSDRLVTAWRRQPGGAYQQTAFSLGIIRLHVLPQVNIDLSLLFG